MKNAGRLVVLGGRKHLNARKHAAFVLGMSELWSGEQANTVFDFGFLYICCG